MSYKGFITVFFLTCVIGLGPIIAFNYYIDPLWSYNHEHEHNDVQVSLNERQQKANEIHNSDNFTTYDTLLLGSSRTTYINPHDFTNMNVYNFAVSDLSFKEYKSMIDYAKEEKGTDFERIIIGVDFSRSSKHRSAEDLTIEEYVSNARDPFYRWKNLISLDVLEYSRKNYRLSKADEHVIVRSYNRDNTAFAKQFQKDSVIKATKDKAEKFRNEFYGDNYEYNPEFKEVLEEIKQDNPNTEIIIFTTPISFPLFEVLEEEGNIPDYEHWLNEIIDVYGGVYDFMYPNSVTKDIFNYFDGNHFYPHVGKKIAETISTGEISGDFGVFRE